MQELQETAPDAGRVCRPSAALTGSGAVGADGRLVGDFSSKGVSVRRSARRFRAVNTCRGGTAITARTDTRISPPMHDPP